MVQWEHNIASGRENSYEKYLVIVLGFKHPLNSMRH
jgi:hypothetical protein